MSWIARTPIEFWWRSIRPCWKCRDTVSHVERMRPIPRACRCRRNWRCPESSTISIPPRAPLLLVRNRTRSLLLVPKCPTIQARNPSPPPRQISPKPRRRPQASQMRRATRRRRRTAGRARSCAPSPMARTVSSVFTTTTARSRAGSAKRPSIGNCLARSSVSWSERPRQKTRVKSYHCWTIPPRLRPRTRHRIKRICRARRQTTIKASCPPWCHRWSRNRSSPECNLLAARPVSRTINKPITTNPVPAQNSPMARMQAAGWTTCLSTCVCAKSLRRKRTPPKERTSTIDQLHRTSFPQRIRSSCLPSLTAVAEGDSSRSIRPSMSTRVHGTTTYIRRQRDRETTKGNSTRVHAARTNSSTITSTGTSNLARRPKRWHDWSDWRCLTRRSSVRRTTSPEITIIIIIIIIVGVKQDDGSKRKKARCRVLYLNFNYISVFLSRIKSSARFVRIIHSRMEIQYCFVLVNIRRRGRIAWRWFF